MNVWKALSVISIWLIVGITSWAAPNSLEFVAICATVSTFMVLLTIK